MQGMMKSGARDHKFPRETKTAASDAVGMIKLCLYPASRLGHVLAGKGSSIWGRLSGS